MSAGNGFKAEHAPILIGRVGLSPHDDQATHDYPTLMQLLLPRYADGRHLTREPGVLTIKIDGPIFRITLICPTEAVQTVMETGSFTELFLQVEEHVASAATVWTPTYESKKRSRQKLDRAIE